MSTPASPANPPARPAHPAAHQGAPDLFSLAGKTAVVTGAGGRLGPVWIGALLSAGARVCGLDLPRAVPCPALAALLKAHGPERLVLIEADVTDRESLASARAQCEERFGIARILVNSAGVDQPPSQSSGAGKASWLLQDIPAEVCRGILEVNALGLFQACQEFGGAMAEGGGGVIVNIGSLYAGRSPDPRYYEHLPLTPPFLKPPVYGMSKAAVVNLTRYLCVHWGPQGVRVNTLSPGGVLGGQDEEFKAKFQARVPLGRMAVEADLTGPLLFLVSAAGAYVTGQELLVDGGYTAW